MPHGAPLKERFRVLKDVSVLDLGPGDQVRLEPGESLTLEPFVAHAFWAEGGTALAGEVSLANDDTTDNYFVPPLAVPADRRGRAGALRDGQGPCAALRRVRPDFLPKPSARPVRERAWCQAVRKSLLKAASLQTVPPAEEPESRDQHRPG